MKIADIRLTMDESRATVMVFVDFSKAFDSVDHDIRGTWEKLGNLFIYSVRSVRLLRSYLSDLRQRVSIGSLISPALCILMGLPQGLIIR